MADMAPKLWGIPVVSSTSERNTLFPTPTTNQRVQNLGTAQYERWDGTAWIVDGSRVFDVKRTGALGNGIDDDTQAIQDALTAVTSGDAVYVPPGTYRVTGPLTIPADNVRVYGEGARSVITADFAVSAPHGTVFVADSVDGFALDNLTINGEHGSGVFISHSSGSSITRCSISGATLTNTSGIGVGVFVQDVDGFTFDHNDLFGNGAAGIEGNADFCANTGTYQITNSKITNNRFRSTAVNFNCICFDPQSVLISGNECTGAIISPVLNQRQGYGIALYGTGTVTAADVRDNVVTNNRIYSVEGTGIYNVMVANTLVSGNHIYNVASSQSDASLGVAGIVISDTNSTGATVVGNIVRTSGKAGISILSSKVVVTGNNIYDCVHGISVRGAVSDITIASNHVENVTLFAIGSYSNLAQARIHVSGNTIKTLATVGVTVGISSCALSTAWAINDNVLSGANGRGQDISGTGHSANRNVEDGTPWREKVQVRGDVSVTLTLMDAITQRFGTALTADRTVTLPASTAVLVDGRFRIFGDDGTAAHTITVKNAAGDGGATLGTIPNSTKGWIDVEWSTTEGGWRLTGQGTLS